MPELVEGRDFVYVSTDAGAGGYEAFPDVCRLQDGRLLAVYYAGWTHISLADEDHATGGAIAGCYSEDEGRTWGKPFIILQNADDNRDPSVVQLSDGRILCNFFIVRPCKQAKRGFRDLGSYIIESSDGGRTWSTSRPMSHALCSSPIRELPNGRLIVGLYEPIDEDAWGAVALSEDGGWSWTPPIAIDNGGLRLDAETDVIRLADGRLYAAQRTKEESMRFSISEDGGLTWSVSEPMGFPGHSPYLHRTPNNVIVCAHRLPQTSLHFSRDECATWSENVDVDPDHIGAYPSMAPLADGSTLIIYYEEGEGSSIRARKFRVTDAGVEWLSWED